MDKAEEQALFRRFAGVLAEYAAGSPDRKSLAEMLARYLWMAMIAGPEMEEVTRTVLRETGNLDEDSVQLIKQMYFEQMRPAVGEDQLAALRQRYPIQGKAERVSQEEATL